MESNQCGSTLGTDTYNISCAFQAGTDGSMSNTYDFNMAEVLNKAADSGGIFWPYNFIGKFDVSGITAPAWLFNANNDQLLNIPGVISTPSECFMTDVMGGKIISLTGLSNDCESETILVIPPNITIIAKNAFKDNTKLKSVIMPNVAYIRESAFMGNTALKSVNMPNVKYIYNNAFRDNTALESVNMPNVEYIYDNAFRGNVALKNVNMLSVKDIYDNAFQGNTALESINMPNLEWIGGSAFRDNTALKNVVMPNVKAIFPSAFTGCSAITSVIMFQESLCKSIFGTNNNICQVPSL